MAAGRPLPISTSCAGLRATGSCGPPGPACLATKPLARAAFPMARAVWKPQTIVRPKAVSLKATTCPAPASNAPAAHARAPQECAAPRQPTTARTQAGRGKARALCAARPIAMRARACCIPATGGCLSLPATDCGLVGGTFSGPGTTCSTTVCFPEGACCFGRWQLCGTHNA